MMCRPWRAITIAAATSLTVLAACRSDQVSSPALAGPNALLGTAASHKIGPTLREAELAIDSASPGFGGMYLDRSGVLVIVHTDTAALSATLSAMRQIMGDVPELHAPMIVIKKGKYRYSALVNFQRTLMERTPRSGLFSTNIDEVNNRVGFRVADAAASQRVTAAAASAALPSDVVSAEVVPAPRGASGYITGVHDSVAGAFQLGFTAPPGACSAGFTASNWGTAKYVFTAAHCTPTMGAVDTSFWAAVGLGNTRQGQEYADPPYSSALPGCVSGSVCRYSDAASFLWKDTTVTWLFGQIATPSSADSIWYNYGPWDLHRYFYVIGEAADTWFITGTLISKIGQTTAFTEGRVVSPCDYAYNWNTPNHDVICELRADTPAESGDSGSPMIWGWPNPTTPTNPATVYLGGLTSKYAAGSSSSYSTIENIERDFGSLQTYPGKPCC